MSGWVICWMPVTWMPHASNQSSSKNFWFAPQTVEALDPPPRGVFECGTAILPWAVRTLDPGEIPGSMELV